MAIAKDSKKSGKSATQDGLAANILNSIAFFHRSNRTIESAYGHALGVAESSLMQECLASPLAAHTIGKKLCLSPVKITRMVSALESQGFVEKTAHGREVVISLTNKGEKIFYEAYKTAQETFEEAMKNITSEKRKQFADLMSRFSDGLDIIKPASLPKDPPLMVPIRALTRALGLLGRNIFGSEYSPLEWHILSLIDINEATITIANIAQDLGISHASITTAVNRLMSFNLLEKLDVSKDHRAKPLTLSVEGKATLQEVTAQGIKLIQKAMGDFNQEEERTFAFLWRDYSGQSKNEESVSVAPNITVRLLYPSELHNARKFIIATRVELQNFDSIPESMLRRKHKNYGVFHELEGTLIGVVECSRFGIVQNITSKKYMNLQEKIGKALTRG